jgi:hypothetical protein
MTLKASAIAVLAMVAASAAPAAEVDHPCDAKAVTPRGASTGQVSGKRQHQPLTVSKDMAGRDVAPCSSQTRDQAKVAGAPLKGVDVKLGR